MKNKIQLDATYYFIMLMLCSTCFGHHCVHHQELTTIAFGYRIGRLVLELAFGQDTHPSCLHLTSNQQQLENQTAYAVTKRYRRELLMMDTMVPETCRA